MKLFIKIAYSILAVVTAITLSISFFMKDANPISQLSLLIEAIGFGWVSGMMIGSDI